MWQRECDVLVVGAGAGGAAAAIEAHDLGARVIVVEKNAEGGGSTKYSGGSLRTYADRAKAICYLETICEGTTPRSVIAALVEEGSKDREWVHKLGGDTCTYGLDRRYPLAHSGPAFPGIPNAEGIGPRVHFVGEGQSGGMRLWRFLWQKMLDRKIDVLHNTPALELVTSSSGVLGVVADEVGREIRIKARKAVVLACGGFESNRDMQMNYLGNEFYNFGNPGNTGDGIRMALQAGADLWHMNAVVCVPGYRLPGYEAPAMHSMPTPGFIYVDRYARRFVDETSMDEHQFWAELSYVDTRTLLRPRIPMYVIFDEETRRAGEIVRKTLGRIVDVHRWSSDNSDEVARGWIRRSDSISDLASRIGLRPDALDETVNKYNAACAAKSDPEFGRLPGTLVPLVRPPFYAIEAWPCLANTQGGPRRDACARVLSPSGRPIPHLYSTGELGSLYHRFYPGGGNITEALAFGRIAASNAVEEIPID